jgi:hypothetical protein
MIDLCRLSQRKKGDFQVNKGCGKDMGLGEKAGCTSIARASSDGALW